MNRILMLAAAALFGWVGVPARAAAADEDIPKAEAILDKYVEVTGGRAAYDKVQTEIVTGAMEFVGKGIKASIVAYKARPRKSYNVIEVEGIGKIEQGTDGEVAWERSAIQGPRIKEGEERASALRDAALNAPWREIYKKAETAGVETIDGRPCYKVILTPDEGKPETRYYDKKTNLLVKGTKTVKTPMGEIPAEVILSDYKEVDGILLPLKLRQKALSQEFLIVIESVKNNVEIPKNRFDLPEDVKALVEKSKAGGKVEPGAGVAR